MTTLDTLSMAKDLEAAGFDQKQAEAVARALAVTRERDLSHFATKADLENLRLSLKAEIAMESQAIRGELRDLEDRLGAKIDTTKTEVVRWMMAQTIVIVGPMAAIVGLMR